MYETTAVIIHFMAKIGLHEVNMVNSTPGYFQDPYSLQNVQPPSSGAPADQKTQQFLANLEKEINELEQLANTLSGPAKNEITDLITKLKDIEQTVKNGGSLSDIKESFASATAAVMAMFQDQSPNDDITPEQSRLIAEIEQSNAECEQQLGSG